MKSTFFNQTMETIVKSLFLNNQIFVFWEKEGTVPYANIGKKEIHIPVICCSEDLDESTKEDIRANFFHELGHILYSSDIKEKSFIFKIWNAIEDLWIEDKISKKYIGIGISINNSNRNIFCQISEKKKGKENSGFVEALLYLMFSEIKFVPKWDIDENTIDMIESAYPIFSKWKESLSSEDNLYLAKQIFELWKDKIKEEDAKSGNKIANEGFSFALTEDGKEEESPIGKERNSNISTKIAEFASSGTIYTSYKTEDSFIKMKCLDSYKSKFKEYKEKLGRPLLSLICSIQEKMEAFILNDSIDGMEEGKINRKMLPQIAFGLRKDVFTVDAEGIDLNTAVSICVDQSYSMNRIDTQVKNTLIVLGETLNKIEIPFEIFSSSTKSPKNKNDAFTRWRSMVFCIYKDFDDNWNSVCHSVMGFKGLENHIDGESISYSVSNLRKRKEKRKIIFIITDGESFSGQDQNSNAEITKNLSTVIMNARKEGIEVYAIAIDCGDTLSNHYGKENVSIIDSKNSLNFSKTILTDICKIITK